VRRGHSARGAQRVVERVPARGGDSTHESPRTSHPLRDDCAAMRLPSPRRTLAMSREVAKARLASVGCPVRGGEGEASARAPRRPSRVARQGSRGL